MVWPSRTTMPASPLHRVVIPLRSTDGWIVARRPKLSNDRIVVLCADKSPLSPAPRIIMNVVRNAWIQLQPLTYGWQIDVAAKVDPLPAVRGPRHASESLGNCQGGQFLLKHSKVVAHDG